MKKNNKLLVLCFVIFVILIIVIYITSRKSNNTINYKDMTEEEAVIVIQERIEEMKKNDLGEMGERDRIEYYIASFIKSIEEKDYKKAYNMLYDDFKKNYFSTYEKFEKYAETKFPATISLEYTNIERNGNIYVVWVKMFNPLGEKGVEKEINFVIQENDLNNFVMSFSVI